MIDDKAVTQQAFDVENASVQLQKFLVDAEYSDYLALILDGISAAYLAGRKTIAQPEQTAHGLVEECRAALAEELAGWDIDPPLQHVKQAHDNCVAWILASAERTH